MEVLLQDLRIGWRNLSRQKGFTLLAIGTLALGIGFNSAIFSVVNTVLLTPLDYPQAESLVWMFGRNSGNDQARVSPPDFLDYHAQQNRFEAFAAFIYRAGVLRGSGRPQRLNGAAVSGEFFQVLGVDPQLGRCWAADEAANGPARLMLLSHALWQRRFGADASIVGQSVRMDGEAYTVLGVMPAQFGLLPERSGLPTPADFWTPLDFQPANMKERRFHFLRVIGRLKEGQSIQSAQQEMDAIASRLEELYPDTNTAWGLNLIPFQEQLVGNVRPALLLLEGAVGLVLLIACANIANLLLARAAGRRREMALRAALGAGRWRLVRQLITESLLMSVLAGLGGLLLAVWGLNAILSLSPGDIPRLQQASLDQRVLFFTLAVSLLTGLLFGLLPALSASKADLNQDLKQGGRIPRAGRRSAGTRSSLVVAEVALAMVLLAGAGLLLKSFMRLLQVDPGFEFSNVLTLQITSAPESSQDAPARFYRALLDEVSALPGVEAAGLADRLPLLQSGNDTAFVPGGKDLSRSEDRQYAYNRLATADYFRTMGIPLLQGRTFSPSDSQQAPVQVIVSRSLAEQAWPDQNPVGQQMTIDLGSALEARVAGVVGSVRQSRLSLEPWQTMYLPYFQIAAGRAIMNLAVKAEGDPLRLAGPVQAAVSRLDRRAAVSSLQPMSSVLGESVARPRFNLSLLSVFSLLALLLATVGIFGVMSQNVAQRRREIGIRLALGARRGQVVKMVVRQGMRLALLGSLMGVAAALLLGRFASSLLFEVQAHDPITLASVALLLLAVALAANLWPARRAGSVDPMHCLRYE